MYILLFLSFTYFFTFKKENRLSFSSPNQNFALTLQPIFMNIKGI